MPTKKFLGIEGFYVPMDGRGPSLSSTTPPVVTPPTDIGTRGAPDYAAIYAQTGPVRITSPTVGQKVAGSFQPTVYVDPSLNASTVKFQIGHKDFGLKTATRVGVSDVWQLSVPFNTLNKPKDQTSALPTNMDIPIWVYAHVTATNGVALPETKYITSRPLRFFTNNYPSATNLSTTFAFRSFQAFTPDYSSATAFRASWDTTWGLDNNPDTATALRSDNNKLGASPLTLITDPRHKLGKKFKLKAVDNHAANDQPAVGGMRAQLQTPRHFNEGDEFWIGWTVQVPVSGDTSWAAEGFPKYPTNSHVSSMQMQAAQITDPSIYNPAWMMDMRQYDGFNGFSENNQPDRWTLSQAGGQYGEPYVKLDEPAYRGNDVGYALHVMMSRDPTKAAVEMLIRRPGLSWEYLEFFKIPGLTRIECIILIPNSSGVRYDLHIYRSLGKWPQVTLTFGGGQVGPTFASVNPFVA